MKRTIPILLVTAMLFVFASCTKYMMLNPMSPVGKENAATMLTKGISKEQEEADHSVTREMVESFILSTSKQEPGSFSVLPYPAEDSPLLFVVNFEEGWKIIPGDTRFGLVLAESDTGHMDLSALADNPGFQLWQEDYQCQIESAKGKTLDGSKAKAGARIWEMFRRPSAGNISGAEKDVQDRELMWGKINFQTNTVTDTFGYKAPLLQTKWGQGNPWNDSMPEMYGYKCLTGCPAVAVSQVLYYFHNQQNMPTGLYESVVLSNTYYDNPLYPSYCTVSVNRSNFTYNSSLWNNMPLDSTLVNPTGYKIVSDLMLDVGARLGQMYSLSVSGVVLSNGYYNTSPCKVTGTWAPYSQPSVSHVTLSLDSNKPVIAVGKDNADNGHTWVMDGYYRAEVTTTNTYEWWPVNMIPSGTVIYGYKSTSELLEEYNYMIYQGMLEVTENSYYIDLLHMNWGWNGRGDGFVTMGSPYNNWQGFTNNIMVQYNLTPSEFTVY